MGDRAARAVTSLAAMLVAIAFVAPRTFAQTLLREWRASGSSVPGFNVVGLGDVDNDGSPDVANNVIGTPAGAGGVRVYSGGTGSVIWEYLETVPNARLGVYLYNAGDVDMDGANDVSANADPWVTTGLTLYSGRNGAVLRTFQTAWGGTGVGDVNQDGYSEVVPGYSNCQGSGLQEGQADLVSTRSWSVLHSWCGTYPMQYFGIAKAAHDVDADGVPDIAIAASGNWPFTLPDGFWVYSGKTYGLIYRVPSPPGSDSFPWSLAGVGDVNADGFDDVAAADRAPRVAPLYYHVNVYLGSNGQNFYTLQSPLARGKELGAWLAGPGDVDGDGHDDVFTGDSYGGGFSRPAGVGFLFSGRNKSVIWQILGTPQQVVVTGNGIGDLNGDEFPDLAVTGGDSSANWIRIYSGAPDGVATIGVGCADARGVVPRIGMTRSAAIGTTFSLNLSRVSPGIPAALVLGVSSTTWQGLTLPLELTMLGLRGCFLRVSPDYVVPLPTGGTGSKGWIAQPVPVPNLASLVGQRFFVQWLALDPANGGSTTRALDVTVRG